MYGPDFRFAPTRMTSWVRLLLHSTLWAILSLLACHTSGWAQTGPVSTTPNAASAIRQTETDNNIRIVGKLCTPTSSTCDNAPVQFLDNDPASLKNLTRWVIDGGAPQIGEIASASFTAAGVKTITLTRSYTVASPTGPQTTTAAPSTFTVNVGNRPTPFQNWKPDTTICKGTILQIDPYPGGAPPGLTYLWSAPEKEFNSQTLNGAITQSVNTTAAGCYSVEVTNAGGCSTQDRIRVDVCPSQSAQPGAKWYFGANAGLDFQGGSPTPLTDGKLNTIEGASSISDPKGNVLFYTDGITIYDKDGNPMKLFDPISNTLTTAASLSGGQRSTQSALIVPKPVCNGCEDYLFYVYTTTEIQGKRQLTYSIVDMRRDKGNGAVIEQNIPVVPSSSTTTSTERSASVRRDRDTTYWVITHDYGKNCFRVKHLTPATSPLDSGTATCLGVDHDSPARGEGQMKIGPAPPASTSGTSATGGPGSGTATAGNSNTAVRPVAVVVPGDSTSPDPEKRKNIVEIYDFNTETGKLEGPKKTINIGTAPPPVYGVEFSPDGKKVYVTQFGTTSVVSGSVVQTGPSRIIQYDITDADPNSTSLLVGESTLRQFGALQIGPDGKIYVAVQGASTLGVIDNTNGGLATTNNPFINPPTFRQDGQDLGGKTSQLGLPNQVTNFNQPANNPGISATNVCQGEPVTLNISPYCPKLKEFYSLEVRNVATNGIVGSWSNFTTTSQTVTTSPGTYTATLFVQVITATGASCTTATAGTSFTVIEQPQSFSLADITKCDSDPVSLSISARADLYAFVLGNQIVSLGPSPVFSTTVTGTYTAFAANGGGQCLERARANVAFYRPSDINLGPPLPLCDNSTRELRLPTQGTSTGFSSYTWTSAALSGPQNTPTITINRPGAYSLVVSVDRPLGPGGSPVTCFSRSSVQVVGARLPTYTSNLVPPTSCTLANGAITVSPSPTTVVSGTATTPGTSFTYAWASGPGTPVSTTGNSASALSEGTYRVRITDANSCSVDAPFTLQSNVPRLTLTPNARPARCGEPNTGTITVGITGGTAVSGIGWTAPAGASLSVVNGVATGLTAGASYTATASNDAGCISSATASVGTSTTATLSLGPNRSKCNPDTINLAASPLGNSNSGISYRWSMNPGVTSASSTTSVNTSGTYSLTATNLLNGCTGSASVTVQFIQEPTVSAGPNRLACLGGPQSQTLIGLSGQSPTGGRWSGPGVTPTGTLTLTAGQVGQVVTAIYSFTVPGTECAASAPQQITLAQTPAVEAGPDVTFCENSGQLVRATGSPGSVFSWNNGTQGSALRTNQSGTYTVTATLNGCPATDQLLITVQPAPRFAITPQAVICVPENERTVLRVVPQDPGQTVVWASPAAATSTSITASAAGTYSAAITGTNGCTATATSRVVDLCEPRLITPTAFSPNGDNTNDRLQFFTKYTTDVELRIYNRWGEVIFASTPEIPDWDGTYRGEPVQPMLYPFTISYKSSYFPERPAAVKRGSVLLLR
jgi:gliding motility-associated-like protein